MILFFSLAQSIALYKYVKRSTLLDGNIFYNIELSQPISDSETIA